ncbi:unnamed protein product [Schistocephalus solidus]|uniref:SH2 domain-containing protein n=1 Tax=Schistocephalus solidus TaxID=70667 RepID=A0A183SFE0_SCHSO|nr:unnamed protein product [Schistocephalus solidus]
MSVAAFVPVVLLCALVRICSQRRQLDFADEVHPEQNAPDGQPGVTYGGTPMAQIRLPAPRYKIPPTKRGLLWAAGLRRTRSSGQLGCGGPDDYPKEFQLQPKRSVQQLYGGEDLRSSKHKIEEADEEAETAVSDGNQKEMVKTSLPTSDATCLHGPEDRSRPKCCNLQIDMRQPCDADLLISASPCKSRLTNRQKVTGRLNSDPQSREHFRLPSSLLLSCWSELSPSSSSSDSALPTTAPSTAPPGIDDCCLRGENDPEVFFSYRFNGQTEREDEEEEEEDSCAVCRQMRESGCIPNEADVDTSKSSPLEQTPSTSSTSDVSSCINGQSTSPHAFPTQTTSVTECRASVHGEEREKVSEQASSPATMQGGENFSNIGSDPLSRREPNPAAVSQLSLTSSIVMPKLGSSQWPHPGNHHDRRDKPDEGLRLGESTHTSSLNCSSAIPDAAIDRLPLVDTSNDPDLPPPLPKTIRAVQQISSGKAPGSDAIPPEVYKHSMSWLMAKLTTIFQEMWCQV